MMNVAIVRCYNLAIVGVLLLKLSCLHQNYAGGMDANLFRFHDFEPRVVHFPYSNLTLKSNPESFNSKPFHMFKAINQTRKSPRNANNSNFDREGRGFHFYSTDTDTTVEIEFIVPFIRIPIEGGRQLARSAARNLLNLKTNSLLWVGAIVTVGALVAGIFNTFGTLIPALFLNGHRKRNIRKGSDFDIFDNYIERTKTSKAQSYDIGTIFDEKLMEHNIDLRACIQMMICLYVRKAAADVRFGKASATQKMFDGFTNANLLSQNFNQTAVQNAIEAGQNSNCHKWKQRCKFLRQNESDIFSIILKKLNSL